MFHTTKRHMIYGNFWQVSLLKQGFTLVHYGDTIVKINVGCGIGNDDIGDAGRGDGEYRKPGNYAMVFPWIFWVIMRVMVMIIVMKLCMLMMVVLSW